MQKVLLKKFYKSFLKPLKRFEKESNFCLIKKNWDKVLDKKRRIVP